MDDDNSSSNESCKGGSSALQLGPRKRALKSDPLVSHGRHFGRTVFALCNYPSLLTNGILQLEQLEDASIEDFSAEERREHLVFERLLDSYPGLLERLREGSEEEVLHVGELIGKGASAARGEDTKSLKPVVINWIVPAGEVVLPPLPWNSKISHGFNHPLTGRLLCPAELDWNDTETKQQLQSGEIAVSGDQWPHFLYANETYDPDDPWNGLLRSRLLINAFRHVFTSPSSVEKEPKATRAGNARIHGMTAVTIPSVAYIATQVRFAIYTTDSETFYHSLLDLLEDPDERGEVTDLFVWWNRQIFPTSSAAKRTLKANSALSKIRQKHAALKDANTSAL
ncbi:uncharacterized protein F5147DRAFT_747980 [Suillus discolor]|uniref:Uncharacterized protein n=1 Tax=Suillus discolor TaxID=1912936 RepID=A0A9P7EV59_9AGAM|nr:uncharacterized protein F5147DRAFT_747980 [Suillus discolor]KAG2092933.1 hypothetical protein F5147DRAFT_747980 [Suillus discolor]